MEALKQLLLVEGGGCWKEGEGQSHLPVCGGEEKTGLGCFMCIKDGKCSQRSCSKNLLKSEVKFPSLQFLRSTRIPEVPRTVPGT